MKFSSLSPRRRKTVVVAICILVFYTLFGFFGIPPIAKSLLVKNLTKELQRACSIEQIKVNPYTLSATIRGLLVQDPDEEPLLSWDELHVNFQLSSFFGPSWNFKSLLIQKPHARAEMRPDGSWNFSDLLNRTNSVAAAPPEPSKPVSVRVGTLLVNGCTLKFDDLTRTQPFRTVVGPLTLDLKELNTSAGKTNNYSLSGTTSGGENFACDGALAFEPFESNGTLSFTGINLNRYSPYYSDQLQCDITGILGVKAAYQAAFGGSNSVLQVTRGELNLQSLGISGPGETNAIKIPEITVSDAGLDLFKQTVDLGAIRTRDGILDLRRSPQGIINLSTLFSPPAAKQTSPSTPPSKPATTADDTQPWSISLGLFELVNYSARFQDQSTPRPVELNLGEIALQMKDFNTQPGSHSRVALSMQWNTNGVVQGGGQLGLFPPSADLTLKLNNLGLQPVDRYLDPLLNLRIEGGSVSLDGKATFAMPEDSPLTAGFQGSFHLRNLLAVETETDQLLVAWQELALNKIDLSLDQAQVGSVFLDGLRFRFDQTATNNNLAALLKEQSAAPNASSVPAAPEPPAASDNYPLNIDSVTLTNTTLRLSDRSNPRPVHLALDDLTLTVTNVSNLPGTNMGLGLSLNLNTNGSIKSSGTVALFPPEADLRLDLKQLALKDFDPYLEPMMDLLVTKGSLDVAGQVRVKVPTNGPLAASFEGDVAVREFGTTTGQDAAGLVDWGSFSLNKLGFQLDPLVLSADAVNLDDFSLAFILTTNGNNFANMIKAQAEGTPAESTALDTNAPQPKITIGEVNLKNANFKITDQSMEPVVNLSLNEFTGKVSGITSEKAGSGVVALSGKVDKAAPFDITGKLDLLTEEKDTDIKIEFNEVEMRPFGPYVGRYLGHKLDQGRITIAIRTVIDGRNLSSENVVTMDQFTLGDTVESPDAVKAPVKLGIALLKDPQGQIKLDVPVKGNLDDPEFRYGRVVWRAVLNLFLKAATSPFALLGKIAGGGDGADLSFVEFQPGSSEPNKMSKLDSLAKALNSRPGLHLEMTGGFNEKADTLMLRRQKLLVKLRLDPVKASGDTNPPVQGKFRMEEYTNAVLTAYARLTSTNQTEGSTEPAPTATRSTPEPIQETVAAPPRRPSRAGLKGAEVLILRGRRNAKAAETPVKPIPSEPQVKEKKLIGGQTDPSKTNAVTATTAGAVSKASFKEMEKQFLEGITTTPEELKALAAARTQAVLQHLTTTGMIAKERLSVKEAKADDKSKSESRVYFDLR